MANELDFLSPYDPEKPIYLQTDRSKTSLGYLLFQPGDKETKENMEEKEKTEEEAEETKRKKEPLGRNIVSMGATGLTPGQRNWSIFEIELLAVCWALNHACYYCINALKIIVRTDHSPLKGLFRKDLSEIDNPRVIKLLEKTLHFNVEVKPVAGKDNARADTFSRMGCEDPLAPDVSRNFFSTRETRTNKLRIKKVGEMRNLHLDLQIIAEEAQTSTTYEDLLVAIREGKSQQELPNSHPGKEFSQDEYNKLHIVQTKRGSLVYLEEKLVPPVEAQKKVLSRLHESHSHEQMSWETA